MHTITYDGKECGQVSGFKRKITYFYEHNKGVVGTTAGFLKLEIRGDRVKIIISIQEPSALPYESADLYFYHEAGDHLSAVKVGTIESVNGILTYHDRTSWQQVYDTGRDLYTFDGVAVVYNESHYYIGDFLDKDRREYPLSFMKQKNKVISDSVVNQQPETETIVKHNVQREPLYKGESNEEEARLEQKEDEIEESMEHLQEQRKSQEQNLQAMSVFDKCENCPYQKKRLEQQENKNAFEKMLKEYPKLPMYGVTELFDCVRIHPRDIGKLDMRNWRLGVNSFLTHGFYTYQYLLLGKMRFDNGKERPIIGVPGVFSNRDKYLANMFGFEQFIPVKRTGMKTGEFGYWIVEIQ